MRLFIFFLLLSNYGVQAQACTERFFTKEEKAVISDYYWRARENDWYINDKGVIAIIEYPNTDGKKVWELCMIYEESQYNVFLPKAYAYVNYALVLFFDKEKTISPGFKINQEVLACYKNLVLDRLYISPPYQNRKMVLREKGFQDELEVQVGKNREERRYVDDRKPNSTHYQLGEHFSQFIFK
jgi:hypothetical protein